jgi:uncharacterized membrane protein YoaK (UPF0700 family)
METDMTDQPDRSTRNEKFALVPLLLIMTVAAGAIDAVSILSLGRVFVANMTGNVAFLGFALAGSSGFSVSASLVALGAFLAGAAVGGRVITSTARRMLAQAAASEAALCAAAAIVAISAAGTAARYAMTVLLAVAMGGQNATARLLAVPDMTTSVLTLTLTGLVADQPDLSAPNSHTVRRLSSVAAILAGAAGGALIVLNASTGWALATTAAMLAAAAVATPWAK